MKLSTALSAILLTECVSAFSPAFVASNSNSRISNSASRPFVGHASAGTALKGLLDEINGDDYNLMGSTNESDIKMNDQFEMFLADLVFSTNDPRMDIINRYEEATNEEFLTWLDNKVENSTDPDERNALKDLNDMIKEVKRTSELSKIAEARAAAEAEQQEAGRVADAEAEAAAGRKLSNADILKKAVAIDSAANDQAEADMAPKKTFFEQELTPEIRMSYEDQLAKFLPPYKSGETPEKVVANNYDRFDAQFAKVLTERANGGDEGAVALLQALAQEQQKRIAAATETLQKILSLGDPMRMEGAIVKMAREGDIDESVLLLLEANETQARDAGAAGPANLMKRLRERAAEEKDKQVSSKEIRLIRKLLRAENSQEREAILEDAFTPKENLLVAGTPENAMKAIDGEQPEQDKAMPDVPPPDFINACKAVMLNFGNLSYDDDRGDLASRIKQIASEAEVVATRIYGQGMSLREQQDRMWEDETTSIFDLEKMELEAEARGENAPWTNPDEDDNAILPGFDLDGKMQIGGS